MTQLAHEPSVVLFQALSPTQFAALEAAAWRRIVPCQTDEEWCQLKLRQRYAEMIARQRGVPEFGRAYVVRLVLPPSALADYQLGSVAYEEHLEYQVPVFNLGRLSRQLLEPVELVSVFRQWHSYSVPRGSRPLAAMIG